MLPVRVHALCPQHSVRWCCCGASNSRLPEIFLSIQLPSGVFMTSYEYLQEGLPWCNNHRYL